MKKLLIAGVVAAAASALTIAGFAWAAGPPYTVSVGGSSTAGVASYTATSTGTVRLQVKNGSGTVLPLKCTSLSLSGNVTKGTAVNPWASIASSTWTGCTFLTGATTVSQSGTMSESGSGTNATTDTETIQGSVAGTVLNVGASTCSFTVSGASASSGGTAATWFNEPTQLLMFTETGFTGALKVYNVVGCLGQVQNGNPVNFEATLNVSATGGAINLS